MELCGGTHCRATGEIGPFVITHETGVAAGVRRIEAFTGDAAAEWLDARRKTLETMLDALAVPAERAVETLQQLQRETRRLARELEQRKVAAALDTAGTDKAAVPSVVAGVPVITQRVRDLEKAALRSLADSLRDRLGSGVVLLAAENGGKVSLLVSVTRDLTARVHAGNLVKALAPIVGGRGGGGAHFAEAGGKWPGKIDDAFTAGRTVMSRMLEDRAEDGR